MPPLAALAGAGDVLGAEDPARAVADPERAGRLGRVVGARQPHRSRRGAHASSARSISGGPSPALCSTGRSLPPARSTNRGYCSRKTTGTSPVGPLRCLATIRSASLGSASSSYFDGPVDEDDDVRVLLDRPRLAKVGEHRPLVRALLRRARELREADHRDLQLAGEDLQTAAELADLLDPVGARVLGAHQLQVVDDHAGRGRPRWRQPPRLGPQLEQARGRRSRRATAAPSRARCTRARRGASRARRRCPCAACRSGSGTGRR